MKDSRIGNKYVNIVEIKEERHSCDGVETVIVFPAGFVFTCEGITSDGKYMECYPESEFHHDMILIDPNDAKLFGDDEESVNTDMKNIEVGDVVMAKGLLWEVKEYYVFQYAEEEDLIVVKINGSERTVNFYISEIEILYKKQ